MSGEEAVTNNIDDVLYLFHYIMKYDDITDDTTSCSYVYGKCIHVLHLDKKEIEELKMQLRYIYKTYFKEFDKYPDTYKKKETSIKNAKININQDISNEDLFVYHFIHSNTPRRMLCYCLILKFCYKGNHKTNNFITNNINKGKEDALQQRMNNINNVKPFNMDKNELLQSLGKHTIQSIDDAREQYLLTQFQQYKPNEEIPAQGGKPNKSRCTRKYTKKNRRKSIRRRIGRVYF